MIFLIISEMIWQNGERVLQIVMGFLSILRYAKNI